MVKEIKIYIEGDTKQKGKNSDIALREGFHNFFSDLIDKARDRNIRFRLVMSGSKFITFKDFLTGVKTSPNSFVVFLLDSDAEVKNNETAKSFLQRQNPNWFLDDVDDEQCHLMVQIMESWFMADVETLKIFYGNQFKENKLSKNKNVEKIAKSTVEKSIKEATKVTQKGEYHKTKHGAKILRDLNSKKVCNSAAFCRKLFQVISDKLD